MGLPGVLFALCLSPAEAGTSPAWQKPTRGGPRGGATGGKQLMWAAFLLPAIGVSSLWGTKSRDQRQCKGVGSGLPLPPPHVAGRSRWHLTFHTIVLKVKDVVCLLQWTKSVPWPHVTEYKRPMLLCAWWLILLCSLQQRALPIKGQ